MEERSSWISFCWGKIRQGSCNIGVERDVPKNQSETHSSILLWPLCYFDGHGSTYPTQATKTQIPTVWREVGNLYGLWDNNSRFLESNTALRQPYVLPIWKKKKYIYIYICKMNLIAWSWVTFGKTRTRLDAKQGELIELMESSYGPNIEKIHVVKKEINELLHHEEVFWRQR